MEKLTPLQKEKVMKKIQNMLNTPQRMKLKNHNYYETKRKQNHTFCECCNMSIDKYYMNTHIKTKKHLEMEKINQKES